MARADRWFAIQSQRRSESSVAPAGTRRAFAHVTHSTSAVPCFLLPGLSTETRDGAHVDRRSDRRNERHLERRRAYTRSITIAIPCPPPMHALPTAYRSRRRA